MAKQTNSAVVSESETPASENVQTVEEKLRIATDFLFFLTRSQEMANNWPLRQRVIRTLREMGAWHS